jgi:hypothetical protein
MASYANNSELYLEKILELCDEEHRVASLDDLDLEAAKRAADRLKQVIDKECAKRGLTLAP